MTKSEAIKKMVRPFIAATIVSTTMLMFALGKTVPPELLQLNAIVITFYFVERAMKNGNNPQA